MRDTCVQEIGGNCVPKKRGHFVTEAGGNCMPKKIGIVCLK